MGRGKGGVSNPPILKILKLNYFVNFRSRPYVVHAILVSASSIKPGPRI